MFYELIHDSPPVFRKMTGVIPACRTIYTKENRELECKYFCNLMKQKAVPEKFRNDLPNHTGCEAILTAMGFYWLGGVLVSMYNGKVLNGHTMFLQKSYAQIFRHFIWSNKENSISMNSVNMSF